MKKKLIIGISVVVVVIIGIVLAIVCMPKKNEPVVNEKIKEEVHENKEIAKVSMSDEEKYNYILKANNKSKDECLIEKMDVDFDGVDEFVYYPDKTLVYLGTMKIYGGEEFKEVVDLSKQEGLYKIELLEDKNTKEKVCILNVRIADGFCYHYDKVSKLVKTGERFTTQELFLNSCDSEQEEIVNANVVNDDDRKCVDKYLVNGKKVSEAEYNKEKKKFEEKYKVIKKFEVVSETEAENIEKINRELSMWMYGVEDLKFEDNAQRRTLYGLSQKYKNREGKDCPFYMQYADGDSTCIIDIESNYPQYSYKGEIEKYKNIIEYKIAELSEGYCDDYQLEIFNSRAEDSIEGYVKAQHDLLVNKKEYYHYFRDGVVPDYFYYKITDMLIMNGNNESEEKFKNNARAKKIKVVINNEKEYIFDLADTDEIQLFKIEYEQNHIETPVNITVEVLETYSGEKTNDVYISDVQFAIDSNIPQGR